MFKVPSFDMNTCPKRDVCATHSLYSTVKDYTLSLVMPDFCRTLLEFNDRKCMFPCIGPTSMPKEDILAFTATQDYTHN